MTGSTGTRTGAGRGPTFDSIFSTLRGGQSLTEALGLGPASLVVIEADGSYEQADSLKAAFDGAPAIGTNVFEHAVDVVARHPGILARQQGIAGARLPAAAATPRRAWYGCCEDRRQAELIGTDNTKDRGDSGAPSPGAGRRH